MLRPREDEIVNNCNRSKRKKFAKEKLKKQRIYVLVVMAALILWLGAAANIVMETWTQYTAKKDVVSAFSDMVYSDLTAKISGNGYMGDMLLTENAKHIILEEIAKDIGINRYSILSGEDGCTVLTQKSVNGNVELKLITKEETADGEIISNSQYLCIAIELNNSIESAFEYRDIVSKIMEERDIDTNVYVNLTGSISGKMSAAEKNTFQKSIINEIDGKIKAEKQTDDIYTVYAYDKDIKSYISMGKKKVNINLTIDYNENEDVTEIHLSSPINNEDY